MSPPETIVLINGSTPILIISSDTLILFAIVFAAVSDTPETRSPNPAVATVLIKASGRLSPLSTPSANVNVVAARADCPAVSPATVPTPPVNAIQALAYLFSTAKSRISS